MSQVISIRCVPREGHGVAATMASMVLADPSSIGRKILIANGAADTGYLRFLEETAQGAESIVCVHPTPSEIRQLAAMDKLRRSAWNAERWLSCAIDGTSPVVLLEDDLIFRPGWLQQLETAADSIRRDIGDRFILSGYHRLAFPGEALYYEREKGVPFWGTLCMYVPVGLQTDLQHVFRSNAKSWQAPMDTLIDRWACASRVPIFYTHPSVVQHAGVEASAVGHSSHSKEIRQARGFSGNRQGASVVMTCAARVEGAQKMVARTCVGLQLGLDQVGAPAEWTHMVAVDRGGNLPAEWGQVAAVPDSDWQLVESRSVAYQQTVNIANALRALRQATGTVNVLCEDDLEFDDGWEAKAFEVYDWLERSRVDFILSVCCIMPASAFDKTSRRDVLKLRPGVRFWGLQCLMMPSSTVRLISSHADKLISGWTFNYGTDNHKKNSIGDRVVWSAIRALDIPVYTPNPNLVLHVGDQSICFPGRAPARGELYRRPILPVCSKRSRAESRALLSSVLIDEPSLPAARYVAWDCSKAPSTVRKLVWTRANPVNRVLGSILSLRGATWESDAEALSLVFGPPPPEMENGWEPVRTQEVRYGGWGACAPFLLGLLRLAGAGASILHDHRIRCVKSDWKKVLEILKSEVPGSIDEHRSYSVFAPPNPGDILVNEGDERSCVAIQTVPTAAPPRKFYVMGCRMAWKTRDGEGAWCPEVWTDDIGWNCNSKRAWCIIGGEAFAVKAIIRTERLPFGSAGWEIKKDATLGP